MLDLMLGMVIVLGALLVLAVIAVIVLLRRERDSAAYRALYTYTSKDVEDAREHSVAISKGTTLGKAAEHLAPFLPELTENYTPGDWRFLGSPVDFVVFDGLANGTVQRVLLVEVKSGKSDLNPRQRHLRRAVRMRTLPLEWLDVEMPLAAPGRPAAKIRKLPSDEPAPTDRGRIASASAQQVPVLPASAQPTTGRPRRDSATESRPDLPPH